MFSLFLLSLTLNASPIASDESVLLLELKRTAILEDDARLIAGSIATSIENLDVAVTTIEDMKELVDLQATRSILNQECDTSACMSEIANAIGTRYIVSGRIGRLDDTFILQLSLNDTDNARTLNRHEISAASIGALAKQTPDAVRVLFNNEQTSASAFEFPWLLSAGTVATLAGASVAGGFGYFAAENDAIALDRNKSAAERQRARDEGLPQLGIALVGGVVALVGLSVIGTALIVE